MTLDLSKARRFESYETADGRDAVFLAYDAKLKRPAVFRVGDQVWTRMKDGRHCEKCDGHVYPSIVRKKPRGES